MRGKAVVVTLVVLAGLCLPSCQHRQGEGPQAKHIHVKILMRQDLSCQQVDAGSGSAADTPKLSRSGKDTIVWEQGIIVGSGPAPLVVTFPPTKHNHIGTPFTDSNSQPKFVFKTGDDSGPAAANAKYDTYLYLSVKVGDNYCTNPGDPGVIIDN